MLSATYLLLHILKRTGTDHREADKEYIRLRVGQRSQTIVILLPGRIEQAQRIRLAANHHRHRIVIEYSWHIFRWKFVRCV